MAAYMYPIKIDRKHQVICFEEVREIESDSLTLADLQFVGDDAFSICERDVETGIGMFKSGYKVAVSRTRLETATERDTRVARAEAYMVEYNKRHPNK